MNKNYIGKKDWLISIITTIIVFGLITITQAMEKPVWQGTVKRVIDGDTITIQPDIGGMTKVRLYGIDAPEARQKHGISSKVFLSDMILQKQVTVQPISLDKYGRTIAKLSIDNRDVGVTMVRAGLAWWYCEYARRDKELAQAQKRAKLDKAGLWAEKNPTPPWEFRKQKKDNIPLPFQNTQD